MSALESLDTAQLKALIAQRNYRAIAVELVRLEADRGVISIAALGDDPEDAVLRCPELSLEYVTAPRAGCSVFGYYQYRIAAPATIFIHPAATAARDSFTIVHEYGHHVQRLHETWTNLLYALPRAASTALEERVADAFAAEVLIPADIISFDSSWLSARTLALVHQNVRASRSAVAMRAVEIAPANDNGTVVVCDSGGVVIFARAAGEDIFTPARGVAQPDLTALFHAAQDADGHATGELRGGLRSNSNWIQDDIQGEAAIDYSGMYAFVVLRSTQKYGREQRWHQEQAECANPACELVFTVDASVTICPRCSEPKCPGCSTCSCEPAAASICPNCTMAYSVAEQSGQAEHVCF